MAADPPAAEAEFVNLWKLYILTLIGEKIRDFDIRTGHAKSVIRTLEEQKLLEPRNDLVSILRRVKEYARSILSSESLEGTLNVDPSTLAPTGVSLKIRPREPTPEMRAKGFISVDSLIEMANNALEETGYQIWVLLDRLDVAFAETHDLERNALRALFRVCRDIGNQDHIKLKLFLKSDIWKRITGTGFREASHITKFVVLEWSQSALLNLIIKRLLSNSSLIDEFSIGKSAVLRSFDEQQKLFDRLFPGQVEQGSRKPSTFDWMVSRCADATGKTALRELIHLLTSLRQKEIARLERGESIPPDNHLFDRSVFKAALPEVSEARLYQTVYAEYPELKPLIEKLGGEKTEQIGESLASIWDVDRTEALGQAEKLIEIGFFQARIA